MTEYSRYVPHVCVSNSLRTWFIRRNVPGGYEFWSKKRGEWLGRGGSLFRSCDAAEREVVKIKKLYGGKVDQ